MLGAGRAVPDDPGCVVNLSQFLCPRGIDPSRPNCAAPNYPTY